MTVRNVQQQLASLLKASEEATAPSASAASASSGNTDGNRVQAAQGVEEIQMDLDTDAAGEETPGVGEGLILNLMLESCCRGLFSVFVHVL